MSMLRKRAA